MKFPFKSLLLVLGTAISLYALALVWSGDLPLQTLSDALTNHTGAVVLVLCLSNYVLRGWRWRVWMAHLGQALPWATALRVYLCGYAFTATPGNVGEAARGWLLKTPLQPSQSLSIFGAERVADLLGLLLLSLPALAWVAKQLGYSLWWGLPVLWVLWRLWLSSRERLKQSTTQAASIKSHQAHSRGVRLLQKAQKALVDAWLCLTHQPLSWLVCTLLAWFAQGMAVWLVCEQLGLHISVWLASGVYALSMVGGAASMLPAGLGGTEALLSGLLVWVAQASAQDLALGQAVLITLVVRLFTLWLAVAIGLLTLLYSAWRRAW